ncbi:MAG: type I DNA topoisomerase [Coriobacteriia bacterium]|nr:type I DNA topoisomerase [Coriobacteriia bacterium]MCL2537423.1 type I DNA topoisomerase [Coriobacteriia bacterium]
MKNLLIVESPAKAQTIERYLGSDFVVKSSIGHIRQIPTRDENAIDVENGFATRYVVEPGKKKVVTDLKKAVKNAEQVWLATDEDREGEAIAWHLAEVLDLDVATTKRIAFNEITKTALENAVAHPRTIDMNLVQAQQARQILDRLVGYELSPVVWKKVPGGKSAGRVQSPAVRLVVEREREIAAFTPEVSFKVTAEMHCSECAHEPDTNPDDLFKAELDQTFDSEAAAHDLLQSLLGAHYEVADVSKKPGVRNPSAPYTTSTLQQDANSKIGFSARATMSAAQGLYQAGHITYMRTDSTSLSNTALASISEYVRATYGDDFAQTRQYKTKKASAQEAHEAIRPTNIALEVAGKNDFEQRIYRLIRNRALASQMAPAQIEKTNVSINALQDGAATPVAHFKAKGEAVTFEGFLAVYQRGEEKYLPRMQAGDLLAARVVRAKQSFSKAPGRFTEGSLVKKLEDLGIGRPSTYATILENIKTRGYVQVGQSEGIEREAVELSITSDTTAVGREILTERTGADKGRLVPNAIGELLSDFLHQYFTDIVDYDFTARTEEHLDDIEEGSLNPQKMLGDFYGPFHQLIEDAESIDRKSVAKMREIGTDPKSGKPVSARVGRFGPMLQIGSVEDEEKPRFANLPKGSTIDTVTLEAALEMFKLPRLVGQTEDGQDVKANIGRFGPYIQVGKLYASIKEPDDPFTIDIERALELYAEKLKAEAEKNIAHFDSGIKVLKGRFGPYVTDGTKNVKVPKDVDPATITEEQAKEMIEKAPAKRGRATAKKAPAKKATAKKPAAKKPAAKKAPAKKAATKKTTAKKTTAKKTPAKKADA